MKIKFSIPAILVSLILLSGSAHAQNDDTKSNDIFSNLDFGIKAGFNTSKMYGDVGNNESLPSFHLGMVIDHDIHDELAVSIEPHISVEGQKLNGGYDKITYFNVPILAKWRVSDPISIDAGPHVGIKITEKTKFSDGDTENRNRFKRVAPGVTIGTTYAVNKNWFAQFRFNLKFSDVVRKEGGDSEGSTINLFQLSVGYALD